MKPNFPQETTEAHYFPPSIDPGFMGAPPPVKVGYGAPADTGTAVYFQNYRNEIIAKHQSPPYEWGLMKNSYTPKPDLTSIGGTDFQLEPRKTQISSLDPGRQNEIDSFYKACQMHRDNYKDHSGRLHPLDFFDQSEYSYHCPPDLTSTYLKYPTYYVKYRDPIVLPKSLKRTQHFPSLPERCLRGRYQRSPDSSYKN